MGWTPNGELFLSFDGDVGGGGGGGASFLVSFLVSFLLFSLLAFCDGGAWVRVVRQRGVVDLECGSCGDRAARGICVSSPRSAW